VDVARRGQRLRIRVGAGRMSGRVARNVRFELQLPAGVRPLRLPPGARFERGSRRVLLRIPRLRSAAVRTVVARVERRARIGAPLELIFYARAPGDQLPLTDRWVDRDTVGRRTRRSPRGVPAGAAVASRAFGVCVLGAPARLGQPSALP
jgi:hypothetical protein